MRLVTLTSKRLDQAIELVRKSFPKDNAAPLHLVESVEKITEYRDKYWVAIDKNRVVGICGIWQPRRSKIAWISWFAVTPKYRKLGVGGRLIKKLQAQARSWKINTLRVWTTDEYKIATDWYQRMGFDIIHRDGENMVLNKTTKGKIPPINMTDMY